MCVLLERWEKCIILFYDCISLLIVLYEGGRGLVSIVKVYKTF